MTARRKARRGVSSVSAGPVSPLRGTSVSGVPWELTAEGAKDGFWADRGAVDSFIRHHRLSPPHERFWAVPAALWEWCSEQWGLRHGGPSPSITARLRARFPGAVE